MVAIRRVRPSGKLAGVAGSTHPFPHRTRQALPRLPKLPGPPGPRTPAGAPAPSPRWPNRAGTVIKGPGHSAVVGTGIFPVLPPGHLGLVAIRSGLGIVKQLRSHIGVIDEPDR